MATMNHANLTTYNVPALTSFFCSVFGFHAIDTRGDKLAVLRDSEDFRLTLMFDKAMTPEHGYPGLFHIGFIQPTQQAVDEIHRSMNSQNYAAPKPEILRAGMSASYGFYYEAPGGITVEVSTMNID